MGMSVVVCFAARTGAQAYETITSTLSFTNSAAIFAKRSVRASAQRYSITTVRPSIQPSSRNRRTKTAVHGAMAEAVVGPRKPMVGSLPASCARAATDQAVAPPSSVMNSRRLIAARLRGPPDARVDFIAARAEVDGLGEKPLGAILKCLAFGLGIAIGGNHNDWNIRPRGFGLGQKFKPAHPRHVDIQQDENE